MRASVLRGRAPLLSNLSFKLLPGELSVVAGANGVGKTSFARALAGDSRYSVIASFEWARWRRRPGAALGVFLTFQAPVEIPGVLYAHFLKLVACRAGTAPSLAYKLKLVLKLVGVSVRALSRPVNVGFSGGERRLLELVQMVVMEPDVCVLDEVDSGLDAHKLAILTKLVLAFGASRRCLLVITHSLDLMLALAPDSVYCLKPRGMAYSTRGACKLAACALR